MIDVVAFLMKQHPYLTSQSAEIVSNYVLETMLNFIGCEELPKSLENTYLMKCNSAVNSAGVMNYESYSENGISFVLNKTFITDGLTPNVKVL